MSTATELEPEVAVESETTITNVEPPKPAKARTPVNKPKNEPMTAAQYVKAANKTAVYPDYAAKTYPTLGAAGEIGELANKIKKILRDSNGLLTPETAATLRKEVGDCLWYLAALIRDYGLKTPSFPEATLPDTNLYVLALRLVVHAGKYAEAVLDKAVKKDLNVVVSDSFVAVSEMCILLNTTIQDVAAENIAKLTSRAERGTLLGDGDDR